MLWSDSRELLHFFVWLLRLLLRNPTHIIIYICNMYDHLIFSSSSILKSFRESWYEVINVEQFKFRKHLRTYWNIDRKKTNNLIKNPEKLLISICKMELESFYVTWEWKAFKVVCYFQSQGNITEKKMWKIIGT